MLRKLLRWHWSLLLVVVIVITLTRSAFISSKYDIPTSGEFLAVAHWVSSEVETYGMWSKYSFGAVRGTDIWSLLSVLDSFTKDPISMTKSLVIVLMVASSLSMYFFAWMISNSWEFASVASLVYATSPFLVQGVMLAGHVGLMFGFALAPLFLLVIEQIMRHGASFRYAAILSFLVMVILLARPDAVIYLAALVLIYLSVGITRTAGRQRRSTLVSILKTSSLAAVFASVLMSVRLLPIMLGSSPSMITAGVYFGSGEYYKWSLEVINAIAGISFTPSQSQLICLLVAVAILMFLALHSKSHRHLVAVCLTWYLVGVMMSSGPRGPIGELYMRLANFPVPVIDLLLKGALHVAGRWLLLVAVALSLLSGVATLVVIDFARVIVATHAPSHKWALQIKEKALTRRIVVATMIVIVFFSQLSLLTSSVPLWRIDKEYILAYEFLKNDPDYFRVVPVPFYERWMVTPQGFLQCDQSLLIPTFSGKPTLRVGGWDTSEPWTDYVNQLVTLNASIQVLEVLGLMGVKYVVVHDYPGYTKGFLDREFFLSQRGTKLVYSSPRVQVYLNEFWMPPVYASSEVALLVGGLESLFSLLTLPNFTLRQWVFLFANQLDTSTIRQLIVKHIIKDIVFVNSDSLDLSLLFADASIAYASVHSTSESPQEGWVKYWGQSGLLRPLTTIPWKGYPILAGNLASTVANATLEIPIEVHQDGEYELWIRPLYGPSRAFLEISVNGKSIGEISPAAPSYAGLKWTRIGSLDLPAGKHLIILRNRTAPGHFYNDIDSVALVGKLNIAIAQKELDDLIRKSDTRVSYIFDFEQLLKYGATVSGVSLKNVYTRPTSLGNQGLFSSLGKSAQGVLGLQLNFAPVYNVSASARGTGYIRIDIGPQETRHLNVSSQDIEWLFSKALRTSGSPPVVAAWDISGDVEIDKIAFLASRGLNMPNSQKQSTIVSERLSSEQYRVTVTSEDPAVLVFSEQYHDSWRGLYVEGTYHLHHFIANGYFNGFLIDKGNSTVLIEFAGSKYMLMGATISSCSFMTLVIVLILERLRSPLTRRIKRTPKTLQLRQLENRQAGPLLPITTETERTASGASVNSITRTSCRR